MPSVLGAIGSHCGLIALCTLTACASSASKDAESKEGQGPATVRDEPYEDIVPNFCDWDHKPKDYRCVVDIYGHPACRFDAQGHPVDFENQYYVYMADNAMNTLEYGNGVELYQPILWCQVSPEPHNRMDFEERAGKTMLRVPGVHRYSTKAPIVVTGTMVSSYARKEQCGRFFVDLATSLDGTHWSVDASTAFTPKLEGSDFKVEMTLAAHKLFRVELRAETDLTCAPRLEAFHITVPRRLNSSFRTR
ncbi:hypothetical protein LZC95_25810 [Pendulispora brunnea]|uniref:Uncharacterized protein n=1 Tax=Pendulispora brunnea TaxID=2905690 RepID=A0ABZ2JTT1_9BACT